MGSFLSAATGTNNGFVAEGANLIKQGNLPEQAEASQGLFQNSFGNQGNLAAQLQAIAAGQGPNPAQQMLQQATNRGIQQQAGALASAKGISPALAQRLAAQFGAQNQQQAAAQGAQMQAQQQLGALGQVGNVYNQQAQGALGLYGQQQNAIGNYNSAQAGVQANLNNTNAATAAGNQQNRAGLVGGMLSGLTGGLFAKGGTVPPVQHFADGGMPSYGSWGYNPYMPKGNSSGANLLGSAISGLFKPSEQTDEEAQAGYDEADSLLGRGSMSVDPSMQGMPGVNREVFAPTGGAGALSAFMAARGGQVPHMAGGGLFGSLLGGGGGGGAGGGLLGGLLGGGESSEGLETSPVENPESDDQGSDLLNKETGFGGGPAAQYQSKNVYNPNGGAMGMFGKIAPMFAALNEGGDPAGTVPGQAKVKGDSLKNDTVPAMLSPGEIVIPRHITQHARAPELAAKFVEMELLKQQHDNKMACGGMAKNYADGGGVPEALRAEASEMNQGPNLGMPQQFMPNVGQGVEEQMSVPMGPYAQIALGQQDQLGPAREASSALEQVPNGPASGSVPAPNARPGQQTSRESQVGSGGMDSYLKAKEGAIKDAQAQAAEANYRYNQQEWNANQDRELLMNKIRDGQVDPNRVFNNMSTGEKVLKSIGLVLGGIGSGLTHQPNVALSLLNKQIDNDIKAQEMDLNKNQNLLRENFARTGDIRLAREATRVQQKDMLAMKLEQVENNSQDPFVRQKAQLMRNQLALQNAQTVGQMQMWREMMGQGGGQQTPEQQVQKMRFLNPEMAKNLQERLVPGEKSFASIPVDAKTRERLEGQQQLIAGVKDLQSFVKNNTTVVPGTPAYNVGAQKAKILQSLVREGKLGTVYREGEQPLLDQFVNSNPAGAFKMLKTVPQLNELLESTQRENSLLKQSLGLKPQGVDGLRQVYAPKTFKASK